MTAAELVLAALLIVAAAAAVALYRRLSSESKRALERAASEATAERSRHAIEIEALNDALALRTNELETARRSAEQLKEQIDALTKELETFAYSVSHDLRAPLRHISGYTQLLGQSLEGRLEPEPQRYMSIVAQASRDMAKLIDDILSFSRMARTELQRGRVSLRELVESVIAGLEPETKGRSIDWRIGRLPSVDADPALLRIALTHLVGNAVKFTRPCERAVIEIGADGEEAGNTILYVRDNGVGFDMAYADRLFGMFQRLHTANEFEGTGIGLATVQRIIARHGGRVWAHAAPGSGATFSFTLAGAA